MSETPILKLKVIACDVLNREISFLSSQSPCYINVTFLNQGLHATPDKLRAKLQDEIDSSNEKFQYNYSNEFAHYDYIVLAYGLCSNGLVNLKSPIVPLVVPRAHDCITLLLGSKDLYKEYFDMSPGTYWFSSGWIERSFQPSEEKYALLYNQYLEKYGEDNAQFLLEQEQSWMKDYKNASLVYWDCLKNSEKYKAFTKRSAEFFKWKYNEYKGKMQLLQNMLNATFNEKEVLVVPPNKKVVQSFDEDIFKFID